MLETATLSWAKGLPPLELKAQASLYSKLLVMFSQFRECFVFIASAWRYAAVFPQIQVRRILTWGMVIVGVVITIVTMTIGYTDINKYGKAQRPFWVLTIVLPVIYIVVGLAAFTRKLYNATKQIKSHTGESTLPYLVISNNILMTTTMSACLVVIIISQSLDTHANPFVIPASIMVGITWVFAESMFEVLTLFQKAASAASSAASKVRSATAQNSVKAPMISDRNVAHNNA
jgi:amino acid transporter